MAYKLIEATGVRQGTVIMIDGAPCAVKSFDISKTGKHGHAKVRIEAVGVITGKKKVIVKPGHEKFEVPMIDKRKGQVHGNQFQLRRIFPPLALQTTIHHLFLPL